MLGTSAEFLPVTSWSLSLGRLLSRVFRDDVQHRFDHATDSLGASVRLFLVNPRIQRPPMSACAFVRSKSLDYQHIPAV